jgi:Antibiotic biosynthesis monooxygenase
MSLPAPNDRRKTDVKGRTLVGGLFAFIWLMALPAWAVEYRLQVANIDDRLFSSYEGRRSSPTRRLSSVSILALVVTMLPPMWLLAQEATGTEVSAISELHVIPGHEAAVRQAVQQVQEATLKDPGCAYFFVTARRDELSTIVLFEEFRSEEAF